MNFKKPLIITTLFLAGLAGKANSGILYTQKKANSGILYTQNQVKENVKLEKVINKIEKKHNKAPKYFSKGFLQFEENELIQDSEIEKMIQNYADPNEKINRVNFYANNTIMIDPNVHHIGDGKKSWMPIPESEGTFYKRKFNIEDKLKNPKLGIEVMFSDSNNKIYLNEQEIGIISKMSKSQWKELLEKHKEKTPFLYCEFNISEYLRQGKNTIRIESEKSGWIFRGYDDFLMGRVQIFYNKSKDEKKK